jgi:carbamoyltransferase
MYSLGFSIGHDKGAVLIQDGKVLIGISEERLSRIKHDKAYSPELPILSIDYCLNEYNLKYSDIDLFVYTTTDTEDFTTEKFTEITQLSPDKLFYIPHHLAHAFASFYSSGFDNAVVIVADAMGSILSEKNRSKEWYNYEKAVTDGTYNWAEGYSIYNFESLSNMSEVYKKWIKFPIPDEGDDQVSIGFAYIKGSRQLVYDENRHSWSAGKLMGLASYADPEYVSKYKTNYAYSDTDMFIPTGVINPEVNHKSDFSSKANTAGLYQRNQEESCVHLAKIAKNITGAKNLCVSGGSFLNCNTNELLLKSGLYEDYYFIPPADDSGIPLGCAWFGILKTQKISSTPSQLSPYFGKRYTDIEILETILQFDGITFERFNDFDKLVDIVSDDLIDNKVIGWMQDGSEIGPRALGNRSILASPKNSWVVNYINNEIKKREWYRPFAPSILFEKQSEIFELEEYSPYMLVTTKVKDNWKDKIPAVVHFDGTSRIQSVTKENNKKYHNLISKFYEKTDIPVVLNTSFNGPSEPIIETPLHAIETFLNIGLYSLVVGNFYIKRK